MKYAKKQGRAGVFLYHTNETRNAQKTTDMKTLATTLAIVLMISTVLSVSAQSRRYTGKPSSDVVAQLTTGVTGGGHGTLSTANLGYRCGKIMASTGVIFQNDYFSANGITANVQYEMKGTNHVDLYFNLTTNYMKDAYLSKDLNKSLHNADFAKEAISGTKQYEKFNTLEVFAGFGILVNMSEHLALNADIGIGGHTSEVTNTDYRRPGSISRLDNAAALQLSVGVQFSVDFENGF